MNQEIVVTTGIIFFILGSCMLYFRKKEIKKENDKPIYIQYNQLSHSFLFSEAV